MALRFIMDAVAGRFDKTIQEIQKPFNQAATDAVKEAGQIVLREAATEIAGAGFSSRWQKSVRSEILSNNPLPSMDVSVHFFSRFGFFNVFEEGARISGKPLLWLPLPSVPLGKGSKPLTPRQYVRLIGPLHSARGAQGKPMLVGKGSRAGILRASSKKVSLRKRAVRTGTILGVNVPLYIGVPAITISKKFDIAGIVQRVGNQIGQLFAKHFKPNT